MLNSEQQKAVNHIDGPMLILAGAGAGKTHTLTERVFHMVKNVGIPPDQILCVTFTNKAAKEMRERMCGKLGIPSAGINPYRSSGIPMIGTFHSVGVYFLRLFIDRIGYSKSFVIYDEDDKIRLIKSILSDLKIDEKETPPRQVIGMISGAKNEGHSPEEFHRSADNYTKSLVAGVYREYEKRMREQNALDFDDILLKTYEVLSVPEVLSYFHNRFAYIMVDEYQDTNEIQYRIVKLLAEQNRNLAVVGDDWQGIYSWRWANIKNILHFEKDYPDAFIVKLEENYRSTKTVIEAANSVIKNNREALDKTLWTSNEQWEKIVEIEAPDEKEETRKIASIIDDRVDNYKDWAILYRTNGQSRLIEEALIRKNIPYRVYGGVKFYERKEIKDILAYLRLIFNPSDQASLARIINVPSRKIGDKSFEQLMDYMGNHGGMAFDEAMRKGLDEDVFSWPAKKGFAEFMAIYQDLREFSQSKSVRETLDMVVKRTAYIDYLVYEYGKEEAEAKEENVKEFSNMASRYDGLDPREGLSMFLEDIALITDSDREESGENLVSLMTVHLAKGLEFTNVIIAGAEEAVFPHSRSLMEPKQLEEERRLMYVAMTRAKKRLYITRARERYNFGTYSANPRSRFLKEIPEHLLETERIEPEYRFGSSFGNQYGTAGVGSYGSTGGSLLFQSSTAPSAPKVRSVNKHSASDFSLGDKIRHPQWGEGRIVSLRDDIAEIAFSGANKWIKKLNITIAPIEKL